MGHRGAFLLFLAVLDILYGYSLLTDQIPVALAYPFLSEMTWGIIWITVGAACFLGAFVKKRDRVAFALASILKTAWALRYMWLWHEGNLRAWIAIVVWLAFAATVLVIASWPEPVIVIYPRLPTRQGEHGGDN